MTRMTNRIINLFQSRNTNQQQLDPVFWQALLAVHRHYFEVELFDYTISGRPNDHIFRKLQTLDCFLDLAFELDWVNGDRSTR